MFDTDPNRIHAYREQTAKAKPSFLQLQYCPACKQRRSKMQFDGGHKTCRKCRGLR